MAKGRNVRGGSSRTSKGKGARRVYRGGLQF